MPEQIPSAPMATESIKGRSSRIRRIVTLIVVLVVMALAGTGVYLWYGHGSKGKTQTVKTVYAYGKLAEYKVTASKPGAGMSFDEPEELEKAANAVGQAVLIHHDLKQKFGRQNDAYIAVATTPVTPMPDGAFLQGMSRIMGDPSTAAYKSMSSSLGQFVRDRIEPTKTSVSIGNAKPFTSSHISANAWKFSISAAEKGGKNAVKGEGVYVIGKKAYYYFMLTTVASDWQVDQAMWQKVLSSLQVDQK